MASISPANEVLLAPLIHPIIRVVANAEARLAGADALTDSRAVQVQMPTGHPSTDAAP